MDGSPAATDATRLVPNRRRWWLLPVAGLLGCRAPGVSCGRVDEERDVTDQERLKAEELVSRLEISVGQIPRDGGNAGLIATMIQALNGLRSLLGIVRPH